MKSAKKLLLLLLSLVVLTGVFAVAALAEDASEVATVVYPDGTVDTYTAAGAITPSIAVENGLYYGKGNTLYKDNAGNGWTYTDADGNAVTEITADMIAEGAKITASGLDQVYSTIDITFKSVAEYWKWYEGSAQAATKFVKAGESYTPTGSDTAIQSVKRVDGTYKVYFYDEASLQNFFSWNASVELGGVVLNYQDLRHNATHRVKLYADHSVGGLFDWEKNGYDRPATKNLSGQGGTTGGEATVYFDMNGHSLITTGTATPNSATLFLYSSQQGAHFISKAGTAFYVGDDATLYLGSDQKSTNTSIKDYLNIHAKSLFSYLNSGFGTYIYGGHYYQTDATTSHFAQVSGRVKAVANASFYVKGGIAVFDDSNDRNHGDFVIGTITATGCNFYSNGASPILKGTKGATLKFSDCNFYGVSTTLDSAAGTATVTGGTTAAAITYKTATFFDGTNAFYYTTDAEFAMDFIQGHPSADIEIPPHEIVEGNEMFYVYDPVKVFECDADLNTRVVDAGERVRVYMTVEIDGVKEYKTDAATYESELKALFAGVQTGWKVVLYADATHPAVLAYGSHNVSRYLDLNGHTWTLTGKQSGYAIDLSTRLYIYSSKPGAVLNALDADLLFRTNDYTDKTVTPNVKSYGYLYLGEPNASSTAYGNNLTVNCKQIANFLWSSAVSIYGGIYRQTEGSTAANFMVVSRTSEASSHFDTIRNATFIVTNPNTRILHWAHSGTKVLSNCNFICEGDRSAYLFASDFTASGTIKAPVFENANFYNVIPARQFNYNKSGSSVAVVPTYNYNNKPASFGFPEKVPGDDLDPTDGVMILAYAKNVVEKEIAGKTYPMNAIMTSDLSKVLKLTWGAEIDYWEIGTKPSREAEDASMIKGDTYYTNPVFDLSVVTQIDANGIVTAAGEAEVHTVFGNSQVIAFTYRDTVSDTLYFVFAEECPDRTSVGDKFYELFHAPETAYEIVLYQDMLLSQAVPFGKLGTGSQPQYASLANGNITLDLGGKTLTIAEDIAGINMCNSDHSGYTVYTRAVFGLESVNGGTFTLKSSLPNGKIVNPSNNSLICVGERDSNKVVIEGGNLTIDSVGSIIGSFEIGGMSVTVTGGTYTYHGDRTAFVVGGNVKITDATIVLTNEKAISVFGLANYQHCSTAYTIDGVKAYAPDGTSLFVYNNHQNFAEIATQTKDSGKTNNLSFANCTLVGITFVTEKAGMDSITYSGDMVVDSAELLALAIPTAPEGKVATYYYLQYNDVDYKVAAYLNSADAGLVNWGFGMKEYWLLGETATHDNVVIDDVFGYIFADVTGVAAGEQKATATLAATKPGAIGMSLTLQSQIGLNLIMDPDLLAKAGVKVGSTVVAVNTDKNTGKLKATYAVAPTVATGTVTFVITIEGGYSHEITVSIAKYAETILSSDAHSAAHNLTYAMVEYVRAMNPDANFLAGVSAPEGYDSFTLEGAASGNTLSLLTNIRFNLSGTIAIEVAGSEAAEGKAVNLVLATGRSEWGTIVDGSVVFTGLYVNEFFGNMTLKVYDVTGEGEDAVKKFIEDEEYTYSLANYLHGIIENGATDNEKAGVQALYNYAYYADAYVAATKPAAAN